MTSTNWDGRGEELAERLLTIFGEDGPGGIAIAADSLAVADIADALEHLDPAPRERLFLAFPPMVAAEVLEEVEAEERDELLEAASDERLLQILGEAEADDAVYFLEQLEEGRATTLLTNLESTLRDQLSEQLELPEDSAGRLMTRDVLTLRSFTTASDALNLVRARSKPFEGVLCVIDAQSRLVGVLGLRDLVVAEGRTPVGQIMDGDPIQVTLESDAEDAAELMQRYHIRGLPVLDSDGRLRGQITWDDAMDVLEAEAEEDMLAIAGTSEDLADNDGVLQRAGQRLPYLLVTVVGGFVMAGVIDRFSDQVLSSHPILMAFLPLVPALGGNIGIQSATVTVRSIATGELTTEKLLGRVLREIGTGSLLACLLSVVCGIGALGMILMQDSDAILALVIAFSLLVAVLIAATFGVFIPLACNRMNIDPAIAAGPFITMLNDITGVSIYLLMSVVLLQAIA